MTETKVEGATLTLTHHAAAPIGRVFQAFTDAAQLHKWFGHESFTVENVHMDTRLGGDYRNSYPRPRRRTVHGKRSDPAAQRTGVDRVYLVLGRG